MHENKATGQALINLFLLGSARQLPKRGSDLWADLLMIYCQVLRPGTRGSSRSQAVWRILPAGIRELEVGNQAVSCQPLPPGPPSQPRKESFHLICFPEQAQAMEQWSGEGVGDGLGRQSVSSDAWAGGSGVHAMLLK